MPLAVRIAASTAVYCPRELRRVLTATCTAAAPFEAVALLGGRLDGTEVQLATCLPLSNGFAAPDRFAVDPGEFAHSEARLRAVGCEFVGFLHSHPGDRPTPSQLDRDELWRDCVQVIAGGGPSHWRLRAFVATGDGLQARRWRYWQR